MSATLDIIRARFPGRATLTPEEVAEVIHGSADRAIVGGVRDALVKGIIIPGLRKLGGRWLVPVGPLAAALDALADPDPLPTTPHHKTRHTVIVHPPVAPRRGRVPDAVRLGRALAWGSEVIRLLDELVRKHHLAEAERFALDLGTVIPAARSVLTPRLKGKSNK